MRMIFVVGSSRSGTTMLSRILAKHSSVFTFGELHFFEQLCDTDRLDNSISRKSAIDLADRLVGIQEEGYLHYSGGLKFLDAAEEIVEGCRNSLIALNVYLSFVDSYLRKNDTLIGCDQTPRNILYLDEIIRALPTAKVIIMLRDPRSVLLSQKYKWKRKFLGASSIPLKESIRSYLNYHPLVISKLWSSSYREVERLKDDPQVMLLKYEDLVLNPESQVASLCEFLELDYGADMLNIQRVGSSSIVDSGEEEAGISTSGLDSWKDSKLCDEEIYLCERSAEKLMAQFGYQKSLDLKVSTLKLLALYFLLPIKLSLALFMNAPRMLNIGQAIKKRL